MKLRVVALTAVAGALIVAGCATPGRESPAGLHDSIAQAVHPDALGTAAAESEAARAERALVPPLRVELPKPEVSAEEERFDLAVADAPVQTVLRALVARTRYSMLIPPGLKGSVSVDLKSVTVREALEALRETYGYQYRIEGTRILVQGTGVLTRVYRVNYLVGQREGRSDVRVTSGSVADAQPPAAAAQAPVGGGAGAAAPRTAGRVTDSSRVLTALRSDFWSDLHETLKTIVGTERGRSVVVNPQAGIVVVRADPGEQRHVEDYLKAIRVAVERQVMLEAKVIEVTLGESFLSGVNWAAFGAGRWAGGVMRPDASLGTTGSLATPQFTANPAAGTIARSGSNPDMAGASTGLLAPGLAGGAMMGLAFQSASFASLVQFLESQGTVQVLSSPRIAVLNNQKAVLKVGSDEFFVTNVAGGSVGAVGSTTTGGTTAFPTLTLQPFFSGVALDVTPQIDEEGSVILHVHPQVSSVQQDNRNLNLGTVFGGDVTLPTARSTVSETDSVVRVRDGHIVAIGGLMKADLVDRRSGVPLLNQIPGLGLLFGSRDRVQVKKELVILIKPTVVHGGSELADDAREAGERIRMMYGAPRAGAAGEPLAARR